MDCRVAKAPRSDKSCARCEAADKCIANVRPQAVAIHEVMLYRGSDLIPPWTAASLTLLAVTRVALVARPQAVAILVILR